IILETGSGGRFSMNSRFTALVARMRAQRMLSALAILFTLAIGILIGTVLSRTGVKGSSSPLSDAALLPPMQTPQQLSTTFGQVAKAIEPAVVNVSTESSPKPTRRGNNRRPNRGQDNGEDPFQDFFDRFFGGQQGPGGDDDDQGPNPFQGPGAGRQKSLGSGVVLNTNGYIMTNFHVVDKADRIRVKL